MKGHNPTAPLKGIDLPTASVQQMMLRVSHIISEWVSGSVSDDHCMLYSVKLVLTIK